MKVRLFSDLHIEFYSKDKECDLGLDFNNCDVIILAGDIHIKDKAINWIKKYLPSNKPVLYVLGNHEFYNSAHPKLIDKLKEQTVGSNIQVLENDVFEYEGVNFLGCTLWTDFNLFKNFDLAAYECKQEMTDFKKIRISPNYSKFTPFYSVQIHKKSMDFLQKELIKRKGQTNFVITHHTPSPWSVEHKYKGDIVSSAYASNLDSFIEEYSPKIWVHGHVHESFKYSIGETRILSNPRGYLGYENRAFDKSFTIEI